MHKSKGLVSVIITCYNYGKYLELCIKSAISQTYREIEIIVVNDGSTDNTDEVVEKFLADSRFRYIKQKNAGQANAKNKGVRNAKGDFLAFLDADDRWCPEKIEKQMVCFEDPNIGVVYSRARYIDENDREFDYDMTAGYLQPRRGKVTEWLIFDNFVQFSSSIVRKECFERLGDFDETLKMGIDWDLWLRISTAYQFDLIDERLFFYRMGHSGQMSKNLEERQRCSDRIIEKFLSGNPDILPDRVVRRAYAYTYCSRGDYFRNLDRNKSNGFFLGAIKKNPMEIGAFKGLLKNFLRL